MTEALLEYDFYCPYCGEHIDTLIEFTGDDQEYIEDCQVCCRPTVFCVDEAIDGTKNIRVFSENEVY